MSRLAAALAVALALMVAPAAALAAPTASSLGPQPDGIELDEAPLAGAAGGPGLDAQASARQFRRSTTWSTINICDTPSHPRTVGVRARMRSSSSRYEMSMRFRLQYYQSSRKRWRNLSSGSGDSGWLRVARNKRGAVQSGYSFRLRRPSKGSFRIRGRVSFRWKRSGRVIDSGTLTTTGGRKPTFADPSGFSASRCTIEAGRNEPLPPEAGTEGTAPTKSSWATINVCDTPANLRTIGIRGYLPRLRSRPSGERLFVSAELQFLDQAADRWKTLPESRTSRLRVSKGRLGGKRDVRFRLPRPDSGVYRSRGRITFEWTVNGRSVKKETRTTRRVPGAGGGDPAGFTAATCDVGPQPNEANDPGLYDPDAPIWLTIHRCENPGAAGEQGLVGVKASMSQYGRLTRHARFALQRYDTAAKKWRGIDGVVSPELEVGEPSGGTARVAWGFRLDPPAAGSDLYRSVAALEWRDGNRVIYRAVRYSEQRRSSDTSSGTCSISAP
ncbi:MAG: hypothetical protein ACR2NA_08370 [Solirubrobacterales bacterium]